jgi:UDP-N-acetylglucosamine:LPS N-acetylglucosamine transferase
MMHHEQQINAHFLKQMGAGDWVTAEEFTSDRLEQFVSQLDQYRGNIAQFASRLNGAPDALRAIEETLQTKGQRNRVASEPTMSLSNASE